MQKMRLMTRPDDYKKIGVTPGVVEVWEDGRRTSDGTGEFEWWYFDAIMDDGTKVVVNFNAHMDEIMRTTVEQHVPPEARKVGDVRFLRVRVTEPDGKTNHETFLMFGSDETEMSTDKCNVKFGSHVFAGDLKSYTIKVNPVQGTGVDLRLTSMGESWRPGAGYFVFGEDESHYFTWLCAVPKGKVTGTITYGGKTSEVQGFGYHDHQWANIDHITLWNNWLWARHNLGDYNLLVFDFISSAEYGYKRYPLTFIEDTDGKIVFENYGNDNAKCEILEEYIQEATNKNYPKISRYTFENDGKRLTYTLTADEEIEVSNPYAASPPAMRKHYDEHNLRPSYARYSATGDFGFNDGTETIERKSALIYEFVHLGKEYKA